MKYNTFKEITFQELYGCIDNVYNYSMNTASKLGPHTQTDRGTCPGVGL